MVTIFLCLNDGFFLMFKRWFFKKIAILEIYKVVNLSESEIASGSTVLAAFLTGAFLVFLLGSSPSLSGDAWDRDLLGNRMAC